jgi:type I restriction-modification system DNA methylase subunit
MARRRSPMPIKKSELYSSLWSSCDELRGGMDASQYKDYVLVLLFIKYVSDKYAGQPYAGIKVRKGASFKDMVALKGKPDIGDLINKKIVGPLAEDNKLSDMPDFNDAAKLKAARAARIYRGLRRQTQPAIIPPLLPNEIAPDQLEGDLVAPLL